MQLAVLGGFVVAAMAPLLHRWFGPGTARVMALLPAAIAAWLIGQWPIIAAGDTLWLEWAWVPGLDITLTFMIDGLAWLFAMMVTVIGTLVLIYSGEYLHGHRDLPRFLVVITAFMMSMLGLVLADNLVTLFVFWELTSITSYQLVGFNHTDLAARKSAQQGLFVTVGGGLALLAGLVMLALAGDSWSLVELNARGEQLKAHALYTPLLICVLIGAFTKSAQFPFHFWLPNAMAAPTPVSAYLHSATMVKAGIYLLARLHPALGGTEPWVVTLSLVGALTMAIGAFLAIQHTNVKKLLAYSTVMALGTLTMLLGIGTETALTAFVVFLLGHSLYKGALFMVAGILDHETRTMDVTAMGGLPRHAEHRPGGGGGGAVAGGAAAAARLHRQGTDAGVGAGRIGLPWSDPAAGLPRGLPDPGGGGDRRHSPLLRPVEGDAAYAPRASRRPARGARPAGRTVARVRPGAGAPRLPGECHRRGYRGRAGRGTPGAVARPQPAACAVACQPGAGGAGVPPLGSPAFAAGAPGTADGPRPRGRLCGPDGGHGAYRRVADPLPAERLYAQLPGDDPAGAAGPGGPCPAGAPHADTLLRAGSLPPRGDGGGADGRRGGRRLRDALAPGGRRRGGGDGLLHRPDLRAVQCPGSGHHPTAGGDPDGDPAGPGAVPPAALRHPLHPRRAIA